MNRRNLKKMIPLFPKHTAADQTLISKMQLFIIVSSNIYFTPVCLHHSKRTRSLTCACAMPP